MNNFTQIKSMSTSFCVCVNHLYVLVLWLLYGGFGVARLSAFYISLITWHCSNVWKRQ